MEGMVSPLVETTPPDRHSRSIRIQSEGHDAPPTPSHMVCRQSEGLRFGGTPFCMPANGAFLFGRPIFICGSLSFHQVNIHRPSRWLFICGHSPGFSHAPSQAQVRSANCLGLLQWPVNGLVPYLPFEPPVNGLSLLFPSIVICSPSLSSSSWCLMYSAIAFVFFPTVST